jgi:hypothetical protein
MRRASLSFLFAILSCFPLLGQATIAHWLPLKVGDKWVYLHENFYGAIGGIAHPEITRWKTEETITGSTAILEGTLVILQVQLAGPAPASPHFQVHLSPEAAWLIHNDCLYELGTKDYELGAGDWMLSQRQLTPELRRALSAGRISPDFCFPLRIGRGGAHRTGAIVQLPIPRTGAWRRSARAIHLHPIKEAHFTSPRPTPGPTSVPAYQAKSGSKRVSGWFATGTSITEPSTRIGEVC